MSEKGWGKTVLGWFVVDPAGSAGGSAADAPADHLDADALIRKYAGSAAAAPAAPPAPAIELRGELPVAADGQIDLEVLYKAAGLDAAACDRVAKAQELLRTLPAETPVAVKKQIVEASLKAFGVPTAQIIEAAVQEVQALEAFIQKGQADTQRRMTEAQERIQALEGEIASIRELVQAAGAEQEGRARAANQEKLKIQDVLEFFGREAVAQVVQQSPKLRSPEDESPSSSGQH